MVSAVRVRAAAHWASWADSLRMVRQRNPRTARLMIRQLEADDPVSCFDAVNQCWRVLMDAGLAVPPWDELADTPPRREEEPEPSQPKMGWQQRDSRKLEAKFIHDSVWPALDDSSSPHPFTVWASGVSTVDCTADVQGHRLDPQPFRLLLCRRLHMPLPLSMRTCRCGRQLDLFGHHRAACAVAGVLGKRRFHLECAAAQVCLEAGARVECPLTSRSVRWIWLPTSLGSGRGRAHLVARGTTGDRHDVGVAFAT